MQNYLVVGLLIITVQFAFGQENYTKQEDERASQLRARNIEVEEDSSVLEPYQYLNLEFATIQTSAQRKLLQEQGINLIGYVGDRTYLAAIPKGIAMEEMAGLVEGQLVPASSKLSRALSNNTYPTHAIDENGRILLHLYPNPHAAIASLIFAIEAEEVEVLAIEPGYFKVAARPADIEQLAAIPAVFYLECMPPSPKYEGLVGRQQQRGHWLGIGPGHGFDGAGVALAIGDDGGVNHLDFAGRLFDHTRFDRGSHGDMTAGLAIGGGNVNPQAMGIAPAAVLHLYNIEQYEHIDQAVYNYQELGTVITSTSFWEGCGGDYTQSARELDLQVNHSISLLHCFSAGNQGDSPCGGLYGNIEPSNGVRFGNITGGRKAAKHCITVANLAYNDSLVLNSSRGPTMDGRIKPDLAAPGEGQLTTDKDHSYQEATGTSAAAPSVAGAAALLYQAYRETHGGVDAPSSLIKALLLNTADDLGRVGPDFEYGWGRPHLGRALRSLQEDPILAGAVEHEERRTFSVEVPSGVQRMRVMLYWNDPAGLPMNQQALVNDLDLTVQDSEGSIHLPWVLSSYPHLDSLRTPARPGKDRLNNMEQVEWLHPAPGTYTMQVEGFRIPEGPQTFFLTVLFDEGELTWAYPQKGESLVPQEVVTLRWDGDNARDPLQLAYKLGNNDMWTVIEEEIPANQGWYDWQVPSAIHGSVRLRLRQGMKEVISEAFTVMESPGFAFLPISNETVVLYWDPVPGAEQYQIYKMGYQYMEKWTTTRDTFLHIPTFPGKRDWYSIAAEDAEGEEGRRSLAQLYEHYDCDIALNLQLFFDRFPAENRWLIQSPDGQVWASGGPYPNSLSQSSKEIPLCLPLGCYELKVFDAFEDGMCCQHGQGKFSLALQDGRVLLEGGVFGAQVSLPFCLDEMLLPTLQAAVEVVQPPSCHDEDDGIVQVNLADPTNEHVRYAWSTGDTTSRVVDLHEGQYYVTVSKENESVELSISLKGPDPLIVELHGSPPLCHGEASGWLDAMVMGGTAPYSFIINDLEEWPQLDWDAMEAGHYSLEVVDAAGCHAHAAVHLVPPAELAVSSETIEDDGRGYRRVELSAMGGLAPYQYHWSNGSVGPILEDPRSDRYEVTIVDANGCTIASELLVPAPTEICSSSAKSAEYEWIEQVQIDSVVFQTGNNQGYLDQQDQLLFLRAGRGYTIKIHPGFEGFPFNEYFGIWVDFNRDLDFTDPGEQILNMETWSGSIETQLYLGTVISPGPLSVRIAMQYGEAPTPCGDIGFGEVEDYLIMVENPWYHPFYSVTSFLFPDSTRLKVYPNPVSSGQLQAEINLPVGESANILLFDRIGRILVHKKWKGVNRKSRLKLNVGHLDSGSYWLLVLDQEGVLLESRSIHIHNNLFRLAQQIED